MPRYNFEVRTDTQVRLTESQEFPSTTAVREDAARRIGELLLAHAGELWVDRNWEMDVTDEGGLLLYCIHVSAMRSAAAEALK